MIKLTNRNGFSRFDAQFPIYNWVYPLVTDKSRGIEGLDAYADIDLARLRGRALYVHIPFCDTICNFCLLSKGIGHEGEDKVEEYVTALLCEFDMKGRYEGLTGLEIDAIFFGGGTPSILTPEQIRRIGRKIHETFRLTPRTEFVFEVELKSVTAEKCAAMREIGVNKVRFGIQSMVEKYRKYFNITVSLDETRRKVELLKQHFEFTAMDLIYGMHGQSEDDLLEDLDAALTLGTFAIDAYPISNLAAAPIMHKLMLGDGSKPLTMNAKMARSMLVKEFLYDNGMALYNGHGFARAPRDDGFFMTSAYEHRYNTYLFGSHDMEIIGFGSSALSNFSNMLVANEEARPKYVASMKEGVVPQYIQRHAVPYEKSLTQGLPYQGRMAKSRVPVERCDTQTMARLAELIDVGLVLDLPDEWRLTESAWKWYVNLMYYLSPAAQREELDATIRTRNDRDALVDGLILKEVA